MSRRTLLAAAAGTGIAGVAGCSGRSTSAPAPTSRTPPTSTGPSTPTPTRAPADLSTLGSGVRGDLVRPGDRGYRRATELFNPRFDGARPRAVIYCADRDDVRRTVEFARANGLTLALRSGGHCYGGWSTGSGLVLDVSRLDRVRVGSAAATVGAGARLIDVYAGLAAHGVGIAAGSCPTVGITGLTLGGGIGVLSRAWGLTCDQLTSVELVTADGELHRADADVDEDLFWACRGGGGAQVGVVTALRFRTQAAAAVTVFFLRWPWSRSRRVVMAWRSWSRDVPRRLWSTCKLLTQPDQGEPRVLVGGAWLGAPAGLGGHLDELVATVGLGPAARSATTYSYLAAMQREAGCPDTPAARCATPRTSYDSASNVLLAPVPDEAVDIAVDAVERRQASRRDHEDGIAFDALGGAVSDLAPDATAFPHRHATAVAQYNVTWTPGTPVRTVIADRRWVHGFRTAMTRVVGDHAYVNYADSSLSDFSAAYYGANRHRLTDIRARRDPDGVFGFPQSAQS